MARTNISGGADVSRIAGDDARLRSASDAIGHSAAQAGARADDTAEFTYHVRSMRKRSSH